MLIILVLLIWAFIDACIYTYAIKYPGFFGANQKFMATSVWMPNWPVVLYKLYKFKKEQK